MRRALHLPVADMEAAVQLWRVSLFLLRNPCTVSAAGVPCLSLPAHPTNQPMRRNMTDVERLGTVERYFVEVVLPCGRGGA